MEEGIIVRLDIMERRLRELISKAEKPSVEELGKISRLLKESSKALEGEVRGYLEKGINIPAQKIKEYTETQLNAETWTVELEATLREYSTQNNNSNNAKLPKLSLPGFKGDIIRWSEFWDRFKTSIHDRENIPEADKMSYLLGCLEGEALDTVEGLSVTHTNYNIAVEALKNRYGRKQLVIDAHYEALYELKRATYDATGCREMLNKVERHLRVLGSLGEPVEGNQVRSIIRSKFPETILYELHLITKDNGDTKEIRAGLEKIVTAMEVSKEPCPVLNPQPQISTGALKVLSENMRRPVLKANREARVKADQTKNSLKRKTPKISHPTKPKRSRMSCIFCDGDHFNAKCTLVKTVEERKRKLDKRCYSCFREGHRSATCPSKKPCYFCKGKHNQALCPQTTQGMEIQNKSSIFYENVIMNEPKSYLQTAVARAFQPKTNKSRPCRILLDSGSQRSYITTRLAKDLDLPIYKEDLLMIYVFGADTPTKTVSPSTEVEIKTRRNVHRNLQVNIVPHITDRITLPKKLEGFSVDVTADDGSAGDGIDLLIGNDYYFSFLKNNTKLVEENLFLVDTEFGWMVTGKARDQNKENTLSVITYCQCNEPSSPYYSSPDLPLREPDIKFLWALESIGITDSPKVTREEEAVKHFNDTVIYENQRYQVKWPWIMYPPELPTNYGLAYGRLSSLVQRSELDTMRDYDNIINEQLAAGIIEVLEPQTTPIYHATRPIHYLPHHMVKQEGKRGRIVYDASAKVKDKKGLNECMYRGPSMLEDLTALLLKFRINRIGITADVEKAFLQVGLQEEDRDVTRFLWLKDIEQGMIESNIVHFRFCRVPFGIIASPFLLTATIRYHLSKRSDTLVEEIADRCYVDNLVTGSDTISNAKDLIAKTRNVFTEISMNIREWTSNNKQLMKSIPKQYRGKDNKQTKVLGLMWHLERDTLTLKISENISEPGKIDDNKSKRGVLRTLASLYDPCGFAAPLILPSKLLLQELWKRKLKWDVVLPEELAQQWEDAVTALRTAENIEIPRFLGNTSAEETECELHCFTDASKKAFSAVVYLRILDRTEGKTKVQFIMAKSRVTPISYKEDLKIPKLELLGYVIGKRLLTYVKDTLGLQIKRQCLWTDSGIVLYWTKSEKLLPPFVARRIAEVTQNKEIEHRYVNTEANPADLATRPELWQTKQELWFKGPTFLLEDERRWPVLPEDTQTLLDTAPEDLDLDPEVEGPSSEVEVGEIEPMEITENILDGETNFTEEVDNSVRKLKELQHIHFPEEMAGKETHLSRNLGLFLDMDGLLRCQGRITNTACSYDTKHPVLIPKDSDFTDKIIRQTHEKNHHVGPAHTLSIIRQRYWIPQGKAKVQRILRRCPQCVKHGGGPYKLPPTPALPSERANYSAPFTYTGIDYFGPVFTMSNGIQEKRWVCLYTCLAVRAIHLEIVQNMTAEECLLAMRRFISTRGVPDQIISDNALHFKLSAEVLSNRYCIENRIKWKFIPELSPWHGGFYERLVGIIKHSLKRTLQKQLLNDTQLHTVIKEIEAVANSRPLTCVGPDIEYVLKPADFLTFGRCITVTPSIQKSQPGGTVTQQNLIGSWKKGQVILEEFKRMFIGQYLCSLRERYNHAHRQPRIKSYKEPRIGDMVQLKGESKNRENWKVGKITSLIRGCDGEYRVAKIKVGDAEFTRSVGHLYPLEVEEEETLKDTENKEVPEPSLDEDIGTTEKGPSDLSIPLEIREELVPHETPVPVLEEISQSASQSKEQKDEEVEMSREAETGENVGKLRRMRDSALRAREKIALWTRQLAATL